MFHRTAMSAALLLGLVPGAVPREGPDCVDPFELKDLATNDEIERAYFRWHTFYRGHDEKYHYILDRCSNTVYRVLASKVSNDDMIKLYQRKMELERGPQPMQRVAKRTKEYLAWLEKTKVSIIKEIDRKKDL